MADKNKGTSTVEKPKTPRKKSYKQGLMLVEAGVMTMEGLTLGVKNGIFSPDASIKNYGVDQDIYLKLLQAVQTVNAAAKATTFSVMGRKK